MAASMDAWAQHPIDKASVTAMHRSQSTNPYYAGSVPSTGIQRVSDREWGGLGPTQYP
jgi:hypothetical protein